MNVSIARCLTVWAAVTTSAWGISSWAGSDLALHGSFDEILAGVSALAVIGCALWAWTVTTVVVLGAARGVAWHSPAIPTWAGRAVLTACGLAVLTGVPAHASDASAGAATPGDSAERGAQGIDGLPFPDRATGAEQPPSRQSTVHPGPPSIAGPVAAPVTAPPGEALVRAGDCLWDIAEAHLSPAATNADVAKWAHELYDLNRSTIGPDSDLIQPGQKLQTPTWRQIP